MGAWETAVTHLGGLEIGDSVAELLKKCHMGSVNQLTSSKLLSVGCLLSVAELKAGIQNPVKKSDLLVVKKKNERYCPIYFQKEDMDRELSKAARASRGSGFSQHIMVENEWMKQPIPKGELAGVLPTLPIATTPEPMWSRDPLVELRGPCTGSPKGRLRNSRVISLRSCIFLRLRSITLDANGRTRPFL